MASLITPTDTYTPTEQAAIANALRSLRDYVLHLSLKAHHGFGSDAAVESFLADPTNNAFADLRTQYKQSIGKFIENASGFGAFVLDPQNNQFFVQIIAESISASAKARNSPRKLSFKTK